MNILLAPPRTGSNVVKNLLDYKYGDIAKHHYGKFLDNETIEFDNVIKVKTKDIDTLYYLHRNIFESCVSLLCYEKFPEVVGTEEYSAYLNSTEAFLNLRNNIIRCINFGWNIFCEYSGKKKSLLYPDLMHNRTEFYSNLQKDWDLSDSESKHYTDTIAPSIFEKTKQQHDVGRMLTYNHVDPLAFLTAPTLALLQDWLNESNFITHPDFAKVKAISFERFHKP